MKHIYIPHILAMLAISFVMAYYLTSVSAQTYTAIASGDWSNPEVWVNEHPDSDTCEKTVIIPNGVRIDLDKTIDLKERMELVVNGKLRADEQIFDLSNIHLMGDGKINVFELRADESSVYSFHGNVHVQKARLINNDYPINSTFSVKEELIIVNSTIELYGGKLKLKNNARLMMGSSEIDTIGGKFVTAHNAYLYYIGDGGFTGPELRLRGLRSVNISLDDENSSVILSDNQTLTMDVKVNIGQLDLNGFDLTSYEQFVCAENGSVRGDQQSELALAGNADLTFVKKNAVLKALKVGAKNTEVELRTPLLVTKLVDLSYGKIDLNRNVLTVMGDLRISDFAKVKGNDKKWIKVIDELPVEEFLAREFVSKR